MIQYMCRWLALVNGNLHLSHTAGYGQSTLEITLPSSYQALIRSLVIKGLLVTPGKAEQLHSNQLQGTIMYRSDFRWGILGCNVKLSVMFERSIVLTFYETFETEPRWKVISELVKHMTNVQVLFCEIESKHTYEILH